MICWADSVVAFDLVRGSGLGLALVLAGVGVTGLGSGKSDVGNAVTLKGEVVAEGLTAGVVNGVVTPGVGEATVGGAGTLAIGDGTVGTATLGLGVGRGLVKLGLVGGVDG